MRHRGGSDHHRRPGSWAYDGPVFVQLDPPMVSRYIGWSCLAGYIIFVGWLTLSPRPVVPETAPSWIPYASLEPVLANLWIVMRHPEYLEFMDREALKNVYGNVLLFVPLGWLLPAQWDGAISAGRIVAVAASSSLAVELWQLSIPGRMSTIDDVIMNTLGAGIGATISFEVERTFAKRETGDLRPKGRRALQ